jgi:N-methylhydantoinase A
MLYLASDVGGTFTDLVLIDTRSGEVWVDTVPSSAGDGSASVLGIERLLERASFNIGDLTSFIHSSTIATNAWLERKGADVAFLVTKGFRDVLEIRDQRREYNYGLTRPKPVALVPRSKILEVDERVDAFGAVVTPPSEAEIYDVVSRLEELRPASIAISFLFSFQNNANERLLAKAIGARLNCNIYLSSDINPQIGEYLRANTTVAAAYVGPELASYLESLQSSLKAVGFSSPFRLMCSNGGVATPASIRRNPVAMLLSGPAGGVIASAALGRLINARNLITFDMGGTSADFSLIVDGEPRLTTDRVIKDQPLRVPMLDIETISAGGGSIAAVDHAGSLRVGPHSAGANPGPACYGKGGIAATLTDAAMVLGILDPMDFAGGDLELNAERAREAVSANVAIPLGLTVDDAAFGMIAVACSQMRQAIRTLTVERGQDLRDFSLLAFGGAGSIFTVFMERELGVERVLIPPRPGVFSALGLLMADVRHSIQAAFACDLASLDEAQLKQSVRDMYSKLEDALERDGIVVSDRSYEYLLDLRYRGQFHTLTIPITLEVDGGVELGRVFADFHARHQQEFGHSNPSGALEVVNLRMNAIGRVEKPTFTKISHKSRAAPQPVRWREMLLVRGAAPQRCPVFLRDDLSPGDSIAGPAAVSQSDTTVIILPGQIGLIDDYGVISIRSEEMENAG